MELTGPREDLAGEDYPNDLWYREGNSKHREGMHPQLLSNFWVLAYSGPSWESGLKSSITPVCC